MSALFCPGLAKAVGYSGFLKDLMLRLTLRFFGLFLLAAAFAVFAIDATRTVAAKSLVVTEFAQTAAALTPSKLALLQDVVKRHAPPFLYDPIFTHFLQLPTFVLAAALGLLCFWLARPPRQKIGFSSR